MPARLSRPSPALVVATLALVVALGGTAFAAPLRRLAASIDGATIKDHTIAGVKLKNDTLTGRQIEESGLARVPLAADAASVGGVTFGGWFFWGLGIADWGEVVWDTPAPIFSVGDRSFQLTLSDETFNAGPWGLSAGETYGATVKATVTQLSSSVAHVPDSGSTALLLGLALTGLGLAGYRRRA